MRRADLTNALLAVVRFAIFRLAGRAPRLRSHRLLRWQALTLCASLCWLVSPARADDLSDFEQARAAYEAQDYARAAEAFGALVGTSPPRLSDRLLVLESRKYLAASSLFVNDAARAKEQFRLLLTEEPEYMLDPLAFPKDVVTLFDQTKAELQRAAQSQVEAEKRALEEALLAQRQAELARRQNLARLLALAEQSERREQNSRWVASIPFGVGQFQNDHRGLGVALAMSQGISAAISVVSFLAHQNLRDERPSPDQLDNTRDREAIWRKTNLASFSVFVGLAVLGILDAQVRFVPERVTQEPRVLPPDLKRWAEEQQL